MNDIKEMSISWFNDGRSKTFFVFWSSRDQQHKVHYLESYNTCSDEYYHIKIIDNIPNSFSDYAFQYGVANTVSINRGRSVYENLCNHYQYTPIKENDLDISTPIYRRINTLRIKKDITNLYRTSKNETINDYLHKINTYFEKLKRLQKLQNFFVNLLSNNLLVRIQVPKIAEFLDLQVELK